MSEHQEIIRSIADGDKKTFQQLYELFSDKVYNTALSYVQSEPDAEEITQDVFTSIFRNAAKFKGDAAVSTWVYRITVNTSLNHLKRKNRFSFLSFGQSEIEKPDFEHPGILLEKKESAKALFKVIDTLPDSQKTAFILSFVEELPRQEVAYIMEISLKAVESLLQRAKKKPERKIRKFIPRPKEKEIIIV